MEGTITTETAPACHLNGRSLRMQGRQLQRHRSPLRAHAWHTRYVKKILRQRHCAVLTNLGGTHAENRVLAPAFGHACIAQTATSRHDHAMCPGLCDRPQHLHANSEAALRCALSSNIATTATTATPDHRIAVVRRTTPAPSPVQQRQARPPDLHAGPALAPVYHRPARAAGVCLRVCAG